jgi:hypothetical protein
MRSLLAVGLASLAAALLVWASWPLQADPVEFIPGEVAGLVVVNRVPPSFAFLADTRLAEWISDDPAELESVIRERLGSVGLEAVTEHVERAALAIMGLEQRDRLRFRIDFIAALQPRSGSRGALRDWILETVANRFEEQGSVTRADGPSTVLQGSSPGQIFYLSEAGDCLIMSNSESGWRSVETLRMEPQRRLLRQPRFQLALREVPLTSDLFVYLRGGDAYGLVPEFAYSIDVRNGEAVEKYFELP